MQSWLILRLQHVIRLNILITEQEFVVRSELELAIHEKWSFKDFQMLRLELRQDRYKG